MDKGVDSLRIGVVGLGYVGLVTAAVLANQGHQVVGVDTDKKKIEKLKNNISPLFEPQLSDYFSRNNIVYSDDYASIENSEAVFVCTPTPTVNGRIETRYVEESCSNIARVNGDCTIIIKSTVVPGTARRIRQITGRPIISNPEFTREGSAVSDTEKPDRIVIGGEEGAIVEEIWSFTGAPVIRTTNENAELIKYASNAFLAMKISFINEIADLCERIPGADVETVAKGMGYDRRIAPYFLKAGIGYGGSCFPKDTQALASFGRDLGVSLSLVESTISVNEARVRHATELIDGEMRIRSLGKICVLGITFKDNTDDIRESRPLDLVRALLVLGYEVSVYDPVFSGSVSGVKNCSNLYDCVQQSDAVAVATEWDEFRSIESMGLTKPVFDLKRLLDGTRFTVYRGTGLWKE